MKKIAISLLIYFPFLWVSAQNLKPYIVGYESVESVAVTKDNVSKQLITNGIKIVGQYQPANDKDRAVVVITSTELESAIKKVGGLTGFAATLRVAITRENNQTIVSYTQPIYWGNAYFRADYDKVASNYATLNDRLEKAMKSSGAFSGKSFGSKKGLSAKDLQKYHYMMAMPYFEDVVELGSFESYATAIAKIDANLKKGFPNVKLVSKVTIPGKELTLYNFALSGEKGESKFLPIIDINQPKQTAFLPYEVLVYGNKVLMLHGRYRIALSFPDLTMGTFTKIMSTPGDIEDLLKQVVK
ncbi:MAG TPA: hypothetical protein P5084_04135 [Paludibacter sp.]|nr:hypothetical protein [Paludibacter sp.]